MQAVGFLGMAAGTLTTIAFLPQVIKTWKTRSAKDLSPSMFLIFLHRSIFMAAIWNFYSRPSRYSGQRSYLHSGLDTFIF